MTLNRTVLSIVMFAVVAGFASSTMAQETRPATTTSTTDQASDRPLLAGPTVPEHARDRPGSFGMRDQRRDRPVTVPPAEWMKTLRDVDLTPEQASKARAIVEELAAKNREFRKNHGKEMRELRAAANEARQSNRPLTDEQRARLEALQAKRPKAEVYQQRIWILLNKEQKDSMKKLLKTKREAIARSRAEARDRMMDRPDDRRDRATDRRDDQRDTARDRRDARNDRRKD